MLSAFSFLTAGRIGHITIENDDIISLIRQINPNKATGSDGISGRMLLLCDESVILPLQIIFRNILSTSIYPHTWKLANVTPIFKKGGKQLIKNYRPISLLPICVKFLEKLIFNKLYSYLQLNDLITQNKSGFRSGDSTTNQLLYLVDEIYQAFDSTESIEVRAVFLDVSKAFDKVWHSGLIFKLERNGVLGSLLKLFENYLHNRKQRVALNEHSSIDSGVPQGHYYFLFTSMISKEILNQITNFLLMIPCYFLIIVIDPEISANELNHGLDITHKWAHQCASMEIRI